MNSSVKYILLNIISVYQNLLDRIKKYASILFVVLILLPNLCYSERINYFFNQDILFPTISLIAASIFLLIYNLMFIKSLIIDFEIIFFILIILLIIANSIYFNSISINQNKINIITLFILIYFLFKSSLQIELNKEYRIVMQLYIIVQILIGIFIKNNSNQLIGAFGNPNIFSEHISLLSIYSFKNIFYREKKSNFYKVLKGISIITSLVILCIIIINESRLALILFIIIFLVNANLISKLFSHLYLLFTTIIIFCFLLYFYKPLSIDGRLFIWKICLIGISKNILWGSGFGSFSNTYIQNQQLYFLRNTTEKEIYLADSVLYGFNEYLQIITEFGFIPIAILVIFCFLYFKFYSIGKLRYNVISILPVILFLFASMFSYPLHKYSFMSLLLILIFEIPTRLNYYKKEFRFDFYYKSFMTVLTVVLSFLFYSTFTFLKYEFKWYKKYTNLNDPINCYEVKNDLYFLKNNYVFLYALGGRLNSEKQFICSNVFLQESLNLIIDENVLMLIGDNYVGLNDLRNAEKYYLVANYSVPNKLLPKYKLLIIYEFQHDKINAKYWANKILNTKIKIRAPVTDRIKSYAFNYLKNIK